ncbi:MAG: hypothetical protein ACRD0B_08505 [Acidimicrobiales bacterium]
MANPTLDQAAAARIVLSLAAMPGGWVLWPDPAVPGGAGALSSVSSWTGAIGPHPSCGTAVRLLDGTGIARPDASRSSGFQRVNGGFAEVRDDVKIYPSRAAVDAQLAQLSTIRSPRVRMCLDVLFERSASIGLPPHSALRIRSSSVPPPHLGTGQRGAELRITGAVRIGPHEVPLRADIVTVAEGRTVISYFSLSLFKGHETALDASLVTLLSSRLAHFVR